MKDTIEKQCTPDNDVSDAQLVWIKLKNPDSSSLSPFYFNRLIHIRP